MRATPRKTRLTDQVREAVRTCGQTRCEISEATGISEPSLCHLVNGRRFIGPVALDTLAEYLGLEVVAKRPPKPPANRPRQRARTRVPRGKQAKIERGESPLA